MKSIFYHWLILMLCGLNASQAFAQININTSLSDIELVQRLAGEGVRVSNVNVNCPSKGKKSYGYFTDNTGTLGLRDGLLMTTGAADNARGPNNSAAKSQDNGNNDVLNSNLQDLVISGDKLNDICTISFDVEVFADTLVFNYVFGSEEYLEFVKDYHDVFGFFISGPGINGTQNIALVPNTNTPVSVANINADVNNNYYVSNGTGATPFVNLHVQYDGLTRLLQSRIAVIPCQRYSLTLSIADVKDNSYDSGVFIEGRSLSTNSPKVRAEFPFKRFPNAIEGCYNGQFVFTRARAENIPLTLFYTVSGTATNGLDYDLIGNSITIPAGSKTAILPINSKTDAIREGMENIKIELINNCPLLPPPSSALMNIREEFDYEVPDEVMCRDDSVMLQPNASRLYRYQWQAIDGTAAQFLSCASCPSPMATPPQTISYRVLVTDTLTGCAITDTVTVKVFDRPIADFSFGSSDEYTAADIVFTNLSQNATAYRWEFGDGSTSTETNPIHFFNLPSNSEEIEYKIKLTAFRSNPTCSDKDSSNVVKILKNSLLLPNVITLGTLDKKNDVLRFKGIKDGIWSIIIYNRWGNLVYESDAYRNDWNAPSESAGVYFYLLQNPRRDRKFKGWIEVLK